VNYLQVELDLLVPRVREDWVDQRENKELLEVLENLESKVCIYFYFELMSKFKFCVASNTIKTI
jgi:hypothetical protein